MSLYKGANPPPNRDELGNELKENREDRTNPSWRKQDLNQSMKGQLDEKGQFPVDKQIPHKIDTVPATTAGDSAPVSSRSDYMPYIIGTVGAGVIGTALFWMRKGPK